MALGRFRVSLQLSGLLNLSQMYELPVPYKLYKLSRRECSSLEVMVPQQFLPTFLRVRWSLWIRNYRETTEAPRLSRPQSPLCTFDHVMLSFSQFMNNLKGMTLIVVSLCLPQRKKCFQPVILLHLPLLPLGIYHCFITSALTDSRKATGLISQNFGLIM